MYKGRAVFLGLLGIFLLAAVGLSPWGFPGWGPAALASRKQQDTALRYLELVRTRRWSALIPHLGDNLAGRPEALPRALSGYPGEAPRRRRLVFYRSHHRFGGPAYATLVYDQELADRWLLTKVSITAGEEEGKLVGLRYGTFARPYAERIALHPAGKGFGFYVFLGLVLTMPLFILGVLWVWARTPVPRRAWLWGPFIALGLVRLKLNWSTGALAIQPLAFNILGSGLFRPSATGPWILQVALPVGAVLFLWRRRRWRREEAEDAAPGEPAGTD